MCLKTPSANGTSVHDIRLGLVWSDIPQGVVVEPSATAIFCSKDMLLLSQISDALHPYGLIMTIKESGCGRKNLSWSVGSRHNSMKECLTILLAFYWCYWLYIARRLDVDFKSRCFNIKGLFYINCLKWYNSFERLDVYKWAGMCKLKIFRLQNTEDH